VRASSGRPDRGQALTHSLTGWVGCGGLPAGPLTVPTARVLRVLAWVLRVPAGHLTVPTGGSMTAVSERWAAPNAALHVRAVATCHAHGGDGM
jgi:hypothetical protein